MKNMTTKLTTVLAALLLTAALAVSASEVHWSYSGHDGPEYWATLSPEFSLCGDGTQQSPVDILGITGSTDLADIKFSYKSTQLLVKNNGHTIQVDYAAGSKVTINGSAYELLQFHFHTPSEHQVDGVPFAMEGHLVHINKKGQLAVVGVFMKIGKHNKFIQKIWNVMPSTAGVQVVTNTKINAGSLLPDSERFYRLAGSLTTPPCSEGVLWSVMQKPIQVSAAQVAQFQKIFSANARPVQPIYDRMISENDD